MRLEANGEARVCCAFRGDPISQDGVALSAERQPLMEIWNADTMRELRRDMVEGRSIAGCETCYIDEARGGVSIRLRDNRGWEQGWLNEARATIDDMMALAVDNDFRLPKLPATIEVETGNLCNLKCRTCNSFSSSLIGKDKVHRSWEGYPHSHEDEPTAQLDNRRIRHTGVIEKLDIELAEDTGSEVKRLYFLGGEPLLVRELPRLLERLIRTGRAKQMLLLFVSNGTVVPGWLSLAAQFHSVDLTISVDGYAAQYEYIRYPGRWSKLAHHLELFKKIPNVRVRVTTTIQVNNVLGLTRLFRYLDIAEIGFNGYLLYWPQYLSVSTLPSSIRHLAAARLTEYAENDCRPENRALVLSFAAQIEAIDAAVEPALVRDFMLFTNDLDTSRGQSIHRVDPELVELLEQAGFPWLHGTLHASAESVTPQEQRRRLAPVEARNDALQLERELNTTIKSLRRELTENSARLKVTEEQAAFFKRDGERVTYELAEVYASRSWWVTRPARSVGQRLRRWLQRVRSTGQPDTI
jgi:MoaA/NifB/PqqE/SkfB family radical SAM enzyme